jgi:hypothetical protein
MARPLIIGFVVLIFASFVGAASAQHRVLVIHPGETHTFTATHRGDTVSCGSLHLTVQLTPTYAHIRGETIKRLAYRYVYSQTLVLSVAAPQHHLITATCKRR